MTEEQSKYLQLTKEQFIQKISDNMRMFGVSETVGRVLGIIYMNRGPMTLNQLAEASGMSKTRMSQIVREMIDLNIAEKVYDKNERKDLYDVEQDYYQTFIFLLSSTWRDVIHKGKLIEQKWAQNMEKAQNEKLTADDAEEVDTFIDEIQEWSAYYDWINRVIQFFESGEIFEHIPIRPENKEPSAIDRLTKQSTSKEEDDNE